MAAAKPSIIVVAAVIRARRRVPRVAPTGGVHLAGYWEFPGGKRDAGESEGDALRRELREELDVRVEPGEKLLATAHEYDDRTIELHFYRCALAGVPRPMVGQSIRWVPRTELAALRFPPADADLVALLTAPPAP
jgi:mutator protein MutT